MDIELIKLMVVMFKHSEAAAVDVPMTDKKCVDVLKQMKQFPINHEIMKSTGVEKHLHKLVTTHPCNNIRAMASDVVATWQSVLSSKNQKNREDDHEHYSVKPHKISGGFQGRQVKSSLKKKKKKKREMSPKEKKNDNCSDPCSSPSCPDEVRNKIRQLLAEGLLKVSGEVDGSDPYCVAASLESALFKKWGNFNGPQKLRYRSVIFNIRDPKNPDFRRKILVGEVKPKRVPEMGSQDMASNERQLQIQRMIKDKAYVRVF